MTVSNDKSLGGGIHVCQDGPRDAPALLLIHGTGASLRSWEPMVPLLTGSYHVIRVDLLGCGRSPEPADGNYALPDQARRIGAALDHLGVEHVIAAGHSSGSAVATALAEERPDLVTGVVIINFGPDMGAYIAEEIPIGPVKWSEVTDEQLRRLMRSGFRAGYEIPQAYVDQFRDIDPGVFAAASQANIAYLDERSLPARLASLGKPLLVIFGAEDSRWNPTSAPDYHAVPGATVEMLPGVGHSPNLEDPPRTAALLSTFAATHASRPAPGRAV